MGTQAAAQQRNVETVQNLFEAFETGDLATLQSLFDRDASLAAAPAGVLPGNCTGRSAILEYVMRLKSETNGTFKAVPTVMATFGDRVFVQLKATAQRGDATIASSAVLVVTVDRKIRKIEQYFSDYAGYARFFS